MTAPKSAPVTTRATANRVRFGATVDAKAAMAAPASAPRSSRTRPYRSESIPHTEPGRETTGGRTGR